MILKFRAWNKIDKVMITDLNSPVVFHGVLQHDSDDILMQFTGLQDKNGKDIFAGDLLSNVTGRICSVGWNIYNACWDAEPTNCLGNSLGGACCNWGYHMEVIGNIHQHSHLLDKGE